MKKRSCLKLFPFFFIMLATNLVHGQLKYFYVKGNIELLTGQTVRGFIKDDEIAKMNYKISFKATEEDKNIIMYDTSQIKSFTLDDGDIFELLRFRGHDMENDVSVLAKLIIRGKASLYKTFYNSDDIYIIINGGRTYVLKNDKQNWGTQSAEVSRNFFKNFLGAAVDDIPTLKNKIERITFNEKEISSIVSDYNKLLKAENIIIPEKRTLYIS